MTIDPPPAPPSPFGNMRAMAATRIETVGDLRKLIAGMDPTMGVWFDDGHNACRIRIVSVLNAEYDDNRPILHLEAD